MNLKSRGTLYAGAGDAAVSVPLLVAGVLLLLVLATSAAAAAFRCQLDCSGRRLSDV
jgi:hypothetical protein